MKIKLELHFVNTLILQFYSFAKLNFRMKICGNQILWVRDGTEEAVLQSIYNLQS